MLKVFGYIRVSSKEQEKGHSLEAQEQLIKNYAENNNFEIIKIFKDVETAKKAGRSQFNKMLSVLESVDCLLVEKTDRLYRNFSDYVKLEDFEIDIHLIKENSIISKNSNSHVKLMHGFKVLIAKNYIDNLKEETIKGLKVRAESGQPTSRPPFGYIVENKLYKPDPEKAHFVKELFELYSSGNYSISELKSWLNNQGDNRNRSNIHHILSNIIYSGYYYFQNKLYKGNYEPLISKELFDKVQSIKSKKTSVKKLRVYPLSGLLKNKSGYTFTGEKQKNKIYYSAYISKNKRKKERITESKVFETLDKKVKNISWSKSFSEIVRELARDLLKLTQTSGERETEKAQAQLKRVKRQLFRLYDSYLDEKFSEDYFTQKTKELEKKKKSLENKINKIDKIDNRFLDTVDNIAKTLRELPEIYFNSNNEEKGRILSKLCNSIIIDNYEAEININEVFEPYLTEKVININKSSDKVLICPELLPLLDRTRIYLMSA